MKTLKFEAYLADMILTGEKTSTWRVFDDKDLQEGDIVIFIRRPELKEFAKARLTKVYEKPLGEIDENDMEGHEKYESTEELLRSYQSYYGDDRVKADTIVKIIYFEVLN